MEQVFKQRSKAAPPRMEQHEQDFPVPEVAHISDEVVDLILDKIDEAIE